jgi:hypothetical protein
MSGIVSIGGMNTVLADPDEFDLLSEPKLLSDLMVRIEGAGERERIDDASGNVTARFRASLLKGPSMRRE